MIFEAGRAKQSLPLPPNWQVVEKRDASYPDAVWWYAHPPEDKDIWLGCYARFRNVGLGVQESVRALLSADAHELSHAEILDTESFRTGFPYEVEDPVGLASLQSLLGFKVIVFQRSWKYFSKKTHEMIIDPRQNAAYSFHFFYAAPEEKFEKFWPIANTWLSEVAPTLVQ